MKGFQSQINGGGSGCLLSLQSRTPAPHTQFPVVGGFEKIIPQRLKPRPFCRTYGTNKLVPFQNGFKLTQHPISIRPMHTAESGVKAARIADATMPSLLLPRGRFGGVSQYSISGAIKNFFT
jgi:hypothetical protein